ncbi:helix-turn-helix domain-containing protein [Deinococcus navajonensis]|uniref:Helix-turn-helix domain-containing protein n=1 Tax=Deinococcus navajonensis TaxID=309884 RepID=A0ABV8XNM3_9DEIO
MNVLFVHSAIDDYPLTPEEFRLYAHLARRAGRGTAYPSINSMATACRMNADTARRCLHNLLTYRMLEAVERRGRTTLYTLTKLSRWVKPEEVLTVQEKQAQIGRVRRAEKKAQKAMMSTEPSETRGGVEEGAGDVTPLKRGEGYPSEMKGDHPSQMRGDEGNPPRDSTEGNPSSKSTLEAAESFGDPEDEQQADAKHQTPEGMSDLADPEGLEGSPLSGYEEYWVDSTKLESATVLEYVPGAAAGIAALQPVPRAELDSRDARNPLKMIQLRALMSASNKSRVEYLNAELATATRSGIPRQLLTRLTDAELALAAKAASIDAALHGGFAGAARVALDRLIGEPPCMKSKAPGQNHLIVTPNGSSLEDATQARAREAALAQVEEGSTWYGRATGKAYTIVSNLDGAIEVEGLEGEYSPATFHRNFTTAFSGLVPEPRQVPLGPGIQSRAP